MFIRKLDHVTPSAAHYRSLPPAKKSLGQCFLQERRYATQIVQALGIRDGDIVIEVGPGHGILTSILVETPARVIAIEIDRRLIDPLLSKYGARPNFSLRHEDFLDTDLEPIIGSGTAKIVGNLPYHLAAEVIYKLLTHARMTRDTADAPWVETAVLMMQKEVAERITATPGTKAWGKLSVFAQLEAQANYLLTVPADAFRPVPKVDGGVMRLDFYRIPPFRPTDYELLVRMVRWTFHQRRKMLKTSLASLSGVHPHWMSAEIDARRRPETLSPQEWVTLADIVSRARVNRGQM